MNWAIFISFAACFSYQIIYLIAPYIKKEKAHLPEVLHRYAVLIAARNEETVIRQLIESIQRQNYPIELLDIYVVADNCTDATAEIAYSTGVYVYERFNRRNIGKGYALQYLLEQIQLSGNFEDYDGFFIFDADNLLDENYVREMNRTFHDGYNVVTSYRNSKNFGDNWISSGYALWFLHEAQFLNRGRMRIGNSCMVSGTGYVIAREVLERNGGWNFFLLTEDIEFTADCIANGEKIGYCEKAVFYDEQPISFQVAWNQRLRWVKGYYQVYRKYGKMLASKLGKKGGFSCFDMLMANLPAFILTAVAAAAGLTMTILGLVTAQDISFALLSIPLFVAKTSVAMFLLGIYTVLTEWRQIPMPWYQKIGCVFTFPVYMMTYIPIAFAALKKNVEWKPIAHTVSLQPRKTVS
jgi:cellulose synthase/poly-beta-1,6-N-acetylglucosamine synthase-like glycosyltransferase